MSDRIQHERTRRQRSNDKEGIFKNSWEFASRLDELQNQSHNTVREWLDAVAELANDTDDDTAEVALKVIPVVAVIRSENLILDGVSMRLKLTKT